MPATQHLTPLQRYFVCALRPYERPAHPLFCSFEIDRGIPARCRGDHAELRQALDDSTRHRRALPHHADDVEWLQALDDGVGVREMVVKYGDGRLPHPAPTSPRAKERRAGSRPGRRF